MKIQYASYVLPIWPGSPEEEALNRFIRAHRIIQTRKEFIAIGEQHYWAILIEYLDHPASTGGAAEAIKSKVDYKEILSPEDFTLFSKLREVRKKLAEEHGLPVYAVCTNEQLAEIAKRRPQTLTECMKIEGIGQGKAEKFVPAFIQIITSENNETHAPA